MYKVSPVFKAMIKRDTIAAIATPPGNGGIAVIRISGDNASAILKRIFLPCDEFPHASMVFGKVCDDGDMLDRCYAVLFRAPRSYTGEDVAELHCHGGQVGVMRVLDAVLKGGARAAKPGEFTQRAFLNGKMDLSQAEAVCDFIAAANEESARVSLKQMEGSLKEIVNSCQDKLTDLLAQVEAAVEYPEEDLEPVVTQAVLPQLQVMHFELKKLENSYNAGKLIKDGLDVTIVGKPNVGKSSLMNALTGQDRAIVTDQPGTTRDTIEHSFVNDGFRFNITDTAGIRDTEDLIEAEGIKRSKRAEYDGKLTVFVLDPTQKITEEDEFIFRQIKKSKDDLLFIINKFDLSQSLSEDDVLHAFGDYTCVALSAKTGEGVEQLKEKLKQVAFRGKELEEDAIITNARHRESIQKAAGQICDAIEALEAGMDMDCVTIDLNGAWSSLGELTGKTVSEEIIDRIFEKFCLGK